MDTWLGIIGYGLAAAAYTLFIVLIWLAKTRSQSRVFLTGAFAATAVTATNYAVQMYNGVIELDALVLDSLQTVMWGVVLAKILLQDTALLSHLRQNVASSLMVALFVLAILGELITGLGVWPLESFIPAFHLLQAVMILWLLEQLYRRTDPGQRWMIKPLCLGIGLIYTYDLVYFSDALLTQGFDATLLYGRGWVALIAAPLVLMSVRRIKYWAIRVYVSRDVIFHSTLLVASGGYLLLMAMTGYLIRYLGGGWSNVAQYIFLSLSGVVLATLFLSESLRSHLKVLIAKHFYENKYDYREEWMRFSSILEDSKASAFSVALQAMMTPFGCEKGGLYALDGRRWVEKAQVKLPERNTHAVLFELANNALEHHWIVDIQELQRGGASTPFAYSREAITDVDDIKFIVPIFGADNIRFVCFLSNLTSSTSFNWEDRDLMWVISQQLAVYLESHINSLKIAENQQFDAFNQMSTFLVHDLKNVLAQLELLSKNGLKHRDNPEFIDDVFVTIDSAGSRLGKVLMHLRKHSIHERPNENADVGEIVMSACNERMSNAPQPHCDISESERFVILADRERLKNVFTHLIQNAQDATPEHGYVKVSQRAEDDYVCVHIEDNGEGMSEHFIAERLFKPFDTTKGNAGMGIGAYDAKKFIEQLGGYIDVHSKPGVGTCFDVYIPRSTGA